MSAYPYHVNLHLDADTYERLRAYAEEDGHSVNTVISHAIADFLARRQTRQVLERAQKILQRDAALLRRLSE